MRLLARSGLALIASVFAATATFLLLFGLAIEMPDSITRAPAFESHVWPLVFTALLAGLAACWVVGAAALAKAGRQLRFTICSRGSAAMYLMGILLGVVATSWFAGAETWTLANVLGSTYILAPPIWVTGYAAGRIMSGRSNEPYLSS